LRRGWRVQGKEGAPFYLRALRLLRVRRLSRSVGTVTAPLLSPPPWTPMQERTTAPRSSIDAVSAGVPGPDLSPRRPLCCADPARRLPLASRVPGPRRERPLQRGRPCHRPGKSDVRDVPWLDDPRRHPCCMDRGGRLAPLFSHNFSSAARSLGRPRRRAGVRTTTASLVRRRVLRAAASRAPGCAANRPCTACRRSSRAWTACRSRSTPPRRPARPRGRTSRGSGTCACPSSR